MKNRLVDLSRAGTVARWRSAGLKPYVPSRAFYYVAKFNSLWSGLRSTYMPVRERTSVDNIFHCCVQKTGSIWIRSLLVDLMTYRYCGLSWYHYQSRMMKGRDPRKLRDRTFDEPFPKGSVVSPMYMSYENFAGFPKAGSYRAFFVGRDPRDLVVSWYHSAKKIHKLQGDMVEIRPILENSSLSDGLIVAIEHLADFGLFDALGSWVGAPEADPNVKVVRYEDLIGPDARAVFRSLFDHLDIRMDDEAFVELLDSYSFERVTGRKKGEESKKSKSHLRKAQAGDWRNHFDERVLEVFQKTTGDLVERLGYEVSEFEPAAV